MNRTIKVLLFSDIFIVTGFGLMAPILAIFIKDSLVGGTIFAAGMAVALHILTKASIQLPIGKYVDKYGGRRKFLILVALITASVPFLYILIGSIYDLFAVQILYGIGSGLTYPAWLGLWSKSLDDNHESFEWSVYSTSVGIGTAAMAMTGAAVAQYLGFNITFLIVGFMALIGWGFLFSLEIKRKNKKKVREHRFYHKRRKMVAHPD